MTDDLPDLAALELERVPVQLRSLLDSPLDSPATTANLPTNPDEPPSAAGPATDLRGGPA